MSDDTSRRDFLKNTAVSAAVAGGAGACMCGLSGCGSDTPKAVKTSIRNEDGKIHLDLAKVPELKEVGASVRLTGDGVPTPLVVIRTTQNEYTVVSAKCTHFGRTVDYNHETGILRCVSIGHSQFTLDGKVLKGPAKKPLKCYETTLSKGELIIAT